WFVNDPAHERYVSAVNFVSLPLGTYDKNSVLNLGSRRWKNDIQFDLTQSFFDGFTVDVSADWIHVWGNEESGPGHQVLSQAETFGTYVWLSYDVTPTLRRWIAPTVLPASVSVGYAGLYGGGQSLDGVRTGSAGGEQQV